MAALAGDAGVDHLGRPLVGVALIANIHPGDMTVEALPVRGAAEVCPEEGVIRRERALLLLGVVDPLALAGDMEIDRQDLPAPVGKDGEVSCIRLADDPFDRERRARRRCRAHLRPPFGHPRWSAFECAR
jgi:hypothetical protein